MLSFCKLIKEERKKKNEKFDFFFLKKYLRFQLEFCSFQMNDLSRLEIFPDELFLELFSYISPIELYTIWYGLNHRLNAILRSVQISFDLTENTIVNHEILNYFSQQIIYMGLYVSYDLLDFKKFPNLRSLVIDTILTNEQLQSIQPDILPCLRRLTFSQWWKDKEPSFINNMFDEQKLNSSKISWLKVYHLPSMPDYFLLNPPSKFSYIQTMIFDRITSFDLHIILSFQTILRRLKATIVSWISDDKKWKILFSNQNYQHKHLIHLHITLNTCNKLDELYSLLSHLPSLRYLYVACDSLVFNDFKQLALELNTHVPWLEHFNCSFRQTFIEDMDKLHCLTPLFRHMICKKIQWIGGWHYYSITTGNIEYR